MKRKPIYTKDDLYFACIVWFIVGSVCGLMGGLLW